MPLACQRVEQRLHGSDNFAVAVVENVGEVVREAAVRAEAGSDGFVFAATAAAVEVLRDPGAVAARGCAIDESGQQSVCLAARTEAVNAGGALVAASTDTSLRPSRGETSIAPIASGAAR